MTVGTALFAPAHVGREFSEGVGVTSDVVLSQVEADLEDCVVRGLVAILLGHIGRNLHRSGSRLDIVKRVNLGISLAGTGKRGGEVLLMASDTKSLCFKTVRGGMVSTEQV